MKAMCHMRRTRVGDRAGRRHHSLAALAILLLLGCSSRNAPSGDSEVRAAIESMFNEPDVGVGIGDIGFGTGRSDIRKSQDQLSELPIYRALAAKGLISIANERDLTSNFGGWGDWFALTQDGIKRTATVSIEDENLKQLPPCKAEGGNVNCRVRFDGVDQLWLRIGKSKIQDIVANDSVLIGATRYRVVMGTHTYEVPPDLQAAMDSARGAMGRERRFKVLLEYDPFVKRFKLVALDLAERSKDFSSSSVDDLLAQLRLCGPSGCQ